MNKRTIKFRFACELHTQFACEAGKAFVQDYKYNGLVEELFDPRDNILTPYQFTGMYDCDGKEIYEGDIVEILHNSKRGTVTFKFGSFCVYYDDPSTMSFAFMHSLPEVKIVGNIVEGANNKDEKQS